MPFMQANVIIISVVRDHQMYDTCVRSNPFANCHTLCPLDNTRENKTIPVRYNEFLNGYDFSRPAWFVFCHEDFELKQHFDELDTLDKNVLYGPVGARSEFLFGLFAMWRLLGQITESNKDGSNARPVGRLVPTSTPVETFDGQCLIFHSDLIRETGLRFDEQLSFDLYGEDICICAKERHGIPSHIIALRCQHWSPGNPQAARYNQQLAHLNVKHKDCCYTGISSYDIGGKPGIRRYASSRIKKFLRRILLRER